MLDRLGARFAVFGGIAVSFRTIERFTKDVDLAVVVKDDQEAEALAFECGHLGFVVSELVEHEIQDRMATARLILSGSSTMRVDLLFASSGIESEVVESAEPGRIFSKANVRVATLPSLIALKTLSADWERRPQDIIDLQHLINESSPEDLKNARQLLDLITERGYNRNKDLQQDLDSYIEQFKD